MPSLVSKAHPPFIVPRASLLAVYAAFLIVPFCTGALGFAGDQPPAGDAKLLVVGPRAVETALAPFLAHKARQLPTEFVALQTALEDSAGGDDAEKLKRYLYKRWKKEPIRYVLLVGDASVMPACYQAVWCGEEKWGHCYLLATDLYYADLAKQDGSFEDWNGAKDRSHAQYFGELNHWNLKAPLNMDGIDLLPEVSVGRWPVHNVAQVKLLVAKTIRYEKHVLADDLPAVRRYGFVCCPGFVDVRGTMDDWGRKLEAATGWQPARLYYADDKRNDRTLPPDEKGVETVLRSGVGVLLHCGHGNETSWAGCLDVQRLPYLRDAALPPVMFSVGCETARFAPFVPAAPYVDTRGRVHPGETKGEKFPEPPPPPAVYQPVAFFRSGLGVELMRFAQNGAVAYIGANMVGQTFAVDFVGPFLDHVATTPEPRLGDCWNTALTSYYRGHQLDQPKPRNWSNDVAFQQPMKFNLFGDPSLRLPRGPNPKRELTCLDLQPLANQRLAESADTPGNDLSALPTGEHLLGGVRYCIGARYILLGSKRRGDRPLKVEGIKVGTRFRKLYVLHAVHDTVRAGNLVGSYALRYADGTHVTWSLTYGRDLSNWWSGAESGEPSLTGLVW
jgi:hypothetical protein